jgi:hypothetical protein
MAVAGVGAAGSNPAVGRELPRLAKAADLADLQQQGQSEDVADAGDGLEIGEVRPAFT